MILIFKKKTFSIFWAEPFSLKIQNSHFKPPFTTYNQLQFENKKDDFEPKNDPFSSFWAQ